MPTKEDMRGEMIRQAQELAAVDDIFAAVGEAADAGVDSDFLVGFIKGIRSGDGLNCLDSYAIALREKAAG